MNLLTEENRKRIGNRLFYAALLIELILMIAEKSEYYFDFESYVFRVTFALTALAVVIKRHDKKQWLMIGVVWVFTFICYRITGRNELLRFSTFVMAAQNINLGKTMKATFWINLTGFVAIALLAVTGIMGDVYKVMDYGRGNENELRYVFGFGHPNTLWGCVYALMLLWLWVYGSKARLWMWGVLLGLLLLVGKLTASRTALAIGLFTFVLGLIVRYVTGIGRKKIIYVLTSLVTPVSCVAFSTWASSVGYIPRYEFGHPWYTVVTWIDENLNNRLQNIYRDTAKHAGSLQTWKLFSDKESFEYFDMGWVRLFYWYGIIPAALIALLVIAFIYLCYRQRDAWTLILILSLSIYTVIEATFVSVYIGRNMLLPVLGVYIGYYLERMRNDSKS